MTIQLKKILLTTDFSDYSSCATRYACELAAKFDAELHVLHTLEAHPSPAFVMGLAISGAIRESRKGAEQALTALIDADWAAGRRVVQAVVEGSPRSEVIRYAREHDIDLIVLATHGRTGLSHVLMGSVAESIVRTAPCPVLTVRPGTHQFVMP